MSINSLGSWEKNCCYKPQFLLEKLLEFKKPILWVDADGLIIKKPIIDAFVNEDIAIRVNYDSNTQKIKGINSATIFINYTEEAISFLKAWDRKCQNQLNDSQKEKEVWDERCLSQLIFEDKYPVKYTMMPVGYCRVFDKCSDKIDTEKTFISQFQVSRAYKNFINDNIAIPQFLKNLPPLELKKNEI